ncbi:predicted protein [Scheffersomyces stipitis CBS 6054]|uniref:mitogen-activated protein kinase kinase kinase n=1 Tax=Scheffersomyces stipitis (strain ATCC 58785 / CBS 6054 / NBRC 10063 / NRRL Y-11545) TaxID=322104 RepID=A3LSM4_PICST|nr:predicted protein [Scheffersomyces stipitis CBS 6054]ABN65595.2 predicted protein [Scheffersomyces stipitis CBS 6054]
MSKDPRGSAYGTYSINNSSSNAIISNSTNNSNNSSTNNMNSSTNLNNTNTYTSRTGNAYPESNRRSVSYDAKRIRLPYDSANGSRSSFQSDGIIDSHSTFNLNSTSSPRTNRISSDGVIYAPKSSSLDPGTRSRPPQERDLSSMSTGNQITDSIVPPPSLAIDNNINPSFSFSEQDDSMQDFLVSPIKSDTLSYPTLRGDVMVSPVVESPEIPSAAMSPSPPKSLTNSLGSNAIGSIIGGYNYSKDSLELSAKREQSSYDVDHNRQGSGSSTISNNSTISATTPASEKANKDMRFVRYAMSTQSTLVNSYNNKWSMPNVLRWLEQNSFNQSWKETFRRNEISGNRFLELENFDKNSMIWKQFSKYLVLDDNNNSVDRFIDLLRKENFHIVSPLYSTRKISNESNSPVLLTHAAKSENRKSTPIFYKHKSTASISSSNSSSSLNNRPVSYVDPASFPNTSSHSFFRKHHRSSSIESPTFKESISAPASSIIPNSAGRSGIFSTLRKIGGEKAAEIVKQEARRLSRSSYQSVPEDELVYARNEEKSVTPIIEIVEPDAEEYIDNYDERYLPRANPSTASPVNTILVSKDNVSFVPVSITEADTIDIHFIKETLVKTLGLINIGLITFHMTEFHSKEGISLPDDILLRIVKKEKNIKLLVRQELGSPSGTATFSTNSSDSKSFEWKGDNNDEQGYPATPQYLLGNSKDSKVDYWNFKESTSNDRLSKINEVPSGRTPSDGNDQSKKQLANQHFPLRLPFPVHKKSSEKLNSGSKTPSLVINTKHLNEVKQSVSPSSAQSNNSFRVIRKEGREIDFDKRRKSPYESKAPKLIPNIYSSSVSDSLRSPVSATTVLTLKDEIPLVNRGSNASTLSQGGIIAKRAAPPPPLSNKSSIRRANSVLKRSLKSRSTSVVSLKHGNSRGSGGRSSIGSKNSDIDDDFFVKSVRNDSRDSTLEGDRDDEEDDDDDDDDEFFMRPINRKQDKLQRVTLTDTTSIHTMNVRPPVDELYSNLEKYFPNTNLDQPIIDDTPVSPLPKEAIATTASAPVRKPTISRTFSNANMSPVNPTIDSGDEIFYGDQTHKLSRRRMKTIRVVANEARKKYLERQKNSPPSTFSVVTRASSNGSGLARSNTKMWGQKVVEVTSTEIEKGFVSKLRNNKNGQFEEFAWIKGELIGRGSFGAVYLGLNVTTGEMLAVKQVVVSPEYRDSSKSGGIEALHKEVETMKDLDHVNIVQYLGYEQKGHIYSLFLEYVTGGSIASCMKSFGKFEEPLIRFISKQVLLGLEYLHSNGILHRDLKADNLLLELDGTCKISDFGISKRSTDIYANNAEMSMQGTVFWMAPEVIDSIVEDKKQGYSAKIDIWSLGCVVLEMFAGKRPWSNEAVVSAIYKIGKTKLAPPIPDEIAHLISPEAKHFINSCFIINPEERPTAKQLLAHPFTRVGSNFNFENTKLARAIKFNSRRSFTHDR